MAGSPAERSSEPLPLEPILCPLCGADHAEPLFAQGDLALGVLGRFYVVRCPPCGLVYQNPRVRADRLASCYPANYPPHAREAHLSRKVSLRAATRVVLSRRLGYRHLAPVTLGWRDRLELAFRQQRLVNAFPPFIGSARLLDVGCATGRFLQQMRALGWETSGIEFDAEVAAKARDVTPRIVVGDPAEVSFPDASFDVITAFHVLEHLPDPLGALRNILRWTAPGGLIIVEVPNVGGWGGRLFGRYWSGLELPRHLLQFTPVTMGALVERAGGTVVRTYHKAKPRYWIRSLRFRLRDGRGPAVRLARIVVTSSMGEAILKLLLELLLPLAEMSRRGEAVRFFIRRAGERRAWYDAA